MTSIKVGRFTVKYNGFTQTYFVHQEDHTWVKEAITQEEALQWAAENQ